VPIIGETNLSAYKAGFNSSQSDQAARISFKVTTVFLAAIVFLIYACHLPWQTFFFHFLSFIERLCTRCGCDTLLLCEWHTNQRFWFTSRVQVLDIHPWSIGWQDVKSFSIWLGQKVQAELNKSGISNGIFIAWCSARCAWKVDWCIYIFLTNKHKRWYGVHFIDKEVGL